MRLIVKGKLPSLNDIIKSNRGNIYAAANQKKKHDNLVVLAAKSQRLPKIDYKADFTFTWYCKNKMRDKDNIMAGQKFIFDGLQKAGVIKNDGWSEVGEIIHKFEIDKKNERVEVEIEEVKE